MHIVTTSNHTKQSAEHRGMSSRRLLIAGISWLTLVCGTSFSFNSQARVPSDLDLASSQISQQGFYRISYKANLDQVAINRLHSWTVHVETSQGQPVDGAEVSIDGGMPQHKHGLPTRPRVTQSLGNGDYVVEGMKFQMGGWWQIRVTVRTGEQHDLATFNLALRA
jgi:hypothetical protein